jgi:hypothetical protein
MMTSIENAVTITRVAKVIMKQAPL